MEHTKNIEANFGDSNYYVKRVNEAQGNDLVSLLTMAELLLHAREHQPRSTFKAIIKALKLSEKTVRRLLSVARDPKLNDLDFHESLPASLGHLEMLTQLSDCQFEDAIKSNRIYRNITRAEIRTLLDGVAERHNESCGEKTFRLLTIRVSEDVVCNLDYLATIQAAFQEQIRIMREEMGMESVAIEDHGLMDKIDRSNQRAQIIERDTDLSEAIKAAKLVIRHKLLEERNKMPSVYKGNALFTTRYYHMQEEFKHLGSDVERINSCLSTLDTGFLVEDLERDSSLRKLVLRDYA